MKFNEKDLCNSYLNYIAQLKSTPDEELSELGRISKFWADSFNEKELEKVRDFRNNLPTENN